MKKLSWDSSWLVHWRRVWVTRGQTLGPQTLSVAEDLVVRRESPCQREEDVHGQTSVTAVQLPYGHCTVPVPGTLPMWWKSGSEVPLLPGRADLHGLALCGREHGAAWASWQGGSGWLRAKCSCTADTVEYLERCCKRNQGGEMDPHPQETFMKQNGRFWTKQTFLLQDSFCRLQPRLFTEELLYLPHLQAACLGSHWHSAFLL